MSGRLDSRRVLLTGGGSGIGAAIVERFAVEGARVAACDRSRDGAARVLRAGASFAICDVADADAVQRWVADASDELGGVDVVVAAAGYELVANALELGLHEWDAHIAVMLRGVFVTFQAALPSVVDGGGGSLIALGSNLSFAALPRFTSYTAAKHGVIGLVRSLAIDFGAVGVRVNALCPGPTFTPMIERQLVDVPDSAALLARWEADTMLGRLARPEEIAAGAVFLASEESSYVTGSALMIDGGYTAR